MLSNRDNLHTLPANYRLQYITHPVPSYSLVEQVSDVCNAGCRWVQFRLKNESANTRFAKASALLPLLRRYEATLIINDDVELVKKLDADGVHLGKEDMHPQEARRILGMNKIIGCTANTLADIERLASFDIDYIGLGPFSFTATKEKLSPTLGIEGYKHIAAGMKQLGIEIPVIAIGGIKSDDISNLLETGICGIALSGVINQSKDPVASCRHMLDLLNGAGQPVANII